MGFELVKIVIDYWLDEVLLWEELIDEIEIAKGLLYQKDTKTEEIAVE